MSELPPPSPDPTPTPNPRPAPAPETAAAPAPATSPMVTAEPVPAPEPALPEAFVRRNRRIRQKILDYALGSAIVGLNPIPNTALFTFLIFFGLVFKMMRDIGATWGFPKGQDVLAILGDLFGLFGAIAIGLISWLFIFALGLFWPVLHAFDLAVAFFACCWAIGQTTHQFYASGRPNR